MEAGWTHEAAAVGHGRRGAAGETSGEVVLNDEIKTLIAEAEKTVADQGVHVDELRARLEHAEQIYDVAVTLLEKLKEQRGHDK